MLDPELSKLLGSQCLLSPVLVWLSTSFCIFERAELTFKELMWMFSLSHSASIDRYLFEAKAGLHLHQGTKLTQVIIVIVAWAIFFVASVGVKSAKLHI